MVQITFTGFHSDLSCKCDLQYWKRSSDGKTISYWVLVQIHLTHFIFSVRNIITHLCTSPFLTPHLRSKKLFLMKQLIITLTGSVGIELWVLWYCNFFNGQWIVNFCNKCSVKYESTSFWWKEILLLTILCKC